MQLRTTTRGTRDRHSSKQSIGWWLRDLKVAHDLAIGGVTIVSHCWGSALTGRMVLGSPPLRKPHGRTRWSSRATRQRWCDRSYTSANLVQARLALMYKRGWGCIIASNLPTMRFPRAISVQLDSRGQGPLATKMGDQYAADDTTESSLPKYR